MKKLLFLLLLGATVQAQITTRCPVCPPTLNGVPNGYALRDSSGFARWQFVANDTMTEWSLSGNTGTTASNFIGTIDKKHLIFKQNNKFSGILDDDQTSFGVNAGENVTGSNNSSFGETALQNNANGTNNTAIGGGSLNACMGSDNTAVGYFSGTLFTLGNYNTFLGDNAATTDDSSSYRTAIGYNAVVGKDSATVIGDTLRNLYVGIGTAYPTSKLDVRGSVKIQDGTQANGYVLTSDSQGLTHFAALSASDYTGIPSYADNATAVVALGAGKLYYTDVAGEYILKVTH